MAYIPTEWETGDVITAAKLNNMEQGIEDASLVADKKTFIYDLTIDVQTGTMSVSLNASSPVPAVADFEHPERNQVKIVALNQLPTAQYFVLYLPLAMEMSVTGPDSGINYRYSNVGYLDTTMIGIFTVQFWEVSGEIREELLYKAIE